MSAKDKSFTLEGVQIILRNFEGRQKKYNNAGTRNFGMIIPTIEMAEEMAADEWNVKWLEPREDDPPETPRVPWLPIEANYDRGRPPKIVLMTQTSAKETYLSEETVGQLDWANIVNLDLTVRGRWYDVNNKTGLKAYLQVMYVTIEEDYLDQKYKELREAQEAGAIE